MRKAANRASGAVSIWDLTPLCHPAWWAALALLLLNDNLLKGGGIVPGWLTGKLSDFAFLVLAPVLLTALLPLRLGGRRVLAFALVVGVYVTADLSPVASDAIVALAAKLGFHWRLWPDVTDLLALSVLPGSWWLAGRSQACVRSGRRRLLKATGVFVGGIACLATGDLPQDDHFPFLVNQTDQEQTLTFTGLLKKTPCDADLSTLASTLTADDLADPHMETIASGQVAALDDVPTAATILAGKCQAYSQADYRYTSTAENCSTTIVSVAGGPAVLVSAPRLWSEDQAAGGPFSCSEPPPPKSACAPTMATNRSAGRDALSLRIENGILTFRAGDKLKMVVVSLPEILAKSGDGTGCRSQRDQLNALLAGAESCSLDADCYAVQANIDIPAESLCDVYVNHTLSPATLAQRRATWNSQCRTRKDYSCGGGLAQPPVCRAGNCEEACPGESLPACYAACSTWNLASPPNCAGWEELQCDTANGQRCLCTGTPSKLSCEPQKPISATCSLACTTYHATGSGAASLLVDADAFPARTDGGDDVSGNGKGMGVDSSSADK
jgi:hypothetical protein